MSELFDKSIRTLELPAILQMLADQTSCEAARAKALAVTPSTDKQEVERLQDETDAAREMIGQRGSPAFSGIKPVAESLYRADRGVLSTPGSCWTLPECCAVPGGSRNIGGTAAAKRPPWTTCSTL